MRWPHPYRMPKWILSAAAMGLLAAPSISTAQTALSPSTGKPVPKPAVRTASAKSTARTQAPAVPPAEEAVVPAAVVAQGSAADGDSAVQRELRRLYQENGREAPEVPTPAQLQRANGRTAVSQPMAPVPAPMPVYGANAVAPARTGTAPAASAPTRPTNRNPFVSFFQRIVPSSKPANRAAPPPPATRPTTPAPALANQTPAPAAPPRSYAPYNGTQPKRLAEQPARPAAVATTAPPKAAPVTALPPIPVNVAEKLELEPVVTTPSLPVTASVIAAPPTTGPVVTAPIVTGPSSAGTFIARTTQVEQEPVFEAPVIVEATEASPFEEPAAAAATTDATPLAAAEAEAPQGDFPEPFPEEDEAEADEEAMESPFSGLALDEEPIVAQQIPEEAAPQADSTAEPLPLSVPTANAPVIPAPATAALEPAAGLPVDVVKPAAPLPVQEVEDDEFFPADVAKPAEIATPLEIAKPADAATPAELAKPADEPLLTLPNDPVIAQPTKESPEAAEYAVKMQKIRDRGGMKGLKGFCPVTLRDERELTDAKPEFHSQYRGQKFHFASADAKAKFDQAPAGYAPAAYGADVVVLIRDKDVAEGTLDFAAWFKGQLYLFSSEENHEVFTNDPAKFAAPVGIE